MTTQARFQQYAADGFTLVPVVREVLSDLDTPLSVYLKLADGPHTYLFESVEGGERFGRYSIIGLPARRVYEFRGRELAVREHGEVVDGVRFESSPGKEDSTSFNPPGTRDFTAREALRTSAFWLIALGHGFALFVVHAVSVHAITHLKEGLGYSVAQASLLISLVTVFQIVGVLLGWAIGDRYKKRLIAAACMLDRTGDNSGDMSPYAPQPGPGKWRPDPWNPGQSAWGPGWGTVTTFGIPDSASLRLTNAITLQAWVNASTVSSAWSDVIMKGNANYYLEATSTNKALPAARAGAGRVYAAAALVVNAWTHLAATYDGATLRLYVNGLQVSSVPHTGGITTSTLPLHIGGDSLYGRYFHGRIDEVRIYNRALTQDEIRTDMQTPISP